MAELCECLCVFILCFTGFINRDQILFLVVGISEVSWSRPPLINRNGCNIECDYRVT